MNRLALPVAASLAMLKRDWRVMRSYRLRFITTFLGVAFSLTLFYYLSRLVRGGSFVDPDDYYSYAVVGLIILQMVNATLGGAPATFRGEVGSGNFERLMVSPFGAIGGMLSMQVFPIMNSIATGAVMLGFADLMFGLDVSWSGALVAIPIAVLCALAFTPFSVLLLAMTVLVKQAASGVTWLVALIALVAGLYFPTTLLPDGLRWATDIQPFTPAVDLLRHVLVDTPLQRPVWEDLARLAGFAVVLIGPSLLALRLAIDVGRRRATILEM